MTTTHATARGQSEADTLTDAHAMYNAAETDAPVKTRLGPRFMTAMREDLAHLDALVAGKLTVQHEKLADGAHVRELSEQLVDVLKDIRAMATGVVDDTTAVTLGRGTDWHATEPAQVASSAHRIATFLHEHREVARAIHIDAQHTHDLAHGADAIDATREHHGKLAAASKSDVHARDMLASSLRARAHLVRVKARLEHRKDPAKLAAYESPVAHHRVAHHAPAAPPAAAG
jgi:hypothetical protein